MKLDQNYRLHTLKHGAIDFFGKIGKEKREKSKFLCMQFGDLCI